MTDQIPKNVMLIEPDAWLAELYQTALKRAGLAVSWAKSAADALELCDKHRSDLIITDLRLDGYDGLALLHELASYDDTREIPVVLLSNSSKSEMPLNEERWKHYGVVEYLHKPRTKPADLARAAEHILLDWRAK